ncbi:hypothetical protein FACS1894219_08350 [Clostridia bacterium]|nr:hypothetical protein FACS1894219_08350 [Clostridia bacterium]
MDKITKKLYEDNVEGKITDEWFSKMFTEYETEQTELKARISELSTVINVVREQSQNTEKFVKLVRSRMEIPELTGEIVREFIQRIDVAQGVMENGVKQQKVNIIYNYIGEIPKD